MIACCRSREYVSHRSRMMVPLPTRLSSVSFVASGEHLRHVREPPLRRVQHRNRVGVPSVRLVPSLQGSGDLRGVESIQRRFGQPRLNRDR